MKRTSLLFFMSPQRKYLTPLQVCIEIKAKYSDLQRLQSFERTSSSNYTALVLEQPNRANMSTTLTDGRHEDTHA